MPDNWSELRQEWEYSHAVNAVVMLIALCSVTLSVTFCARWRVLTVVCGHVVGDRIELGETR